MEITKYPQSCLLVEIRGAGRVLVDPGSPLTARSEIEALLPLDGVLVTHQHADHLDRAAVRRLLDRGMPVFAGGDVADLPGLSEITVVAGGDHVSVAGVRVQVFDLPHMPMVDGTPGPPNLGFLLDGRLLHPGDSTQVAHLASEILAVPIAGPSSSARDAYIMVESVGASVAIPMHYEVFPGDPGRFAQWARGLADIRVLESGESVTL